MSFDKLYYQGKEVKPDGFKAKTFRVIVMQKNNPDRLDMRYKCNKEFVRINREFTKKTASSGSELNLSLMGRTPYL